MREKLMENKDAGITLIALVVTIIVLLILAGVSISMLTGQNGIITNAMYAKFSTEIKSIEEQVNLKQMMLDSPYSGSLNDLLEKEIKYNDMLLIEDGELKYISNNFTANEIEWLEKLGVEKASEYYTIDFDTLDENKRIDSQKIRTGYCASKPELPSKDGHKFLGWYYLDEEGTENDVSYNERKFDFTTKVTRNYSLYAKYSGEAVMKAYQENECFWKYKAEITSIYFEKQKIRDDLPELHWDIEESDECSNIVAYLENDSLNGGYKLTIVSPLVIYANADTRSYFDNFTALKYVDFSNFDTSRSRTMYKMFYGCENLETLDVSNFDTRNVTNMAAMFGLCCNLTDIKVENFDTSKVIKMYNMFGACTNLEKLDLSNFDTSNVENMDLMFWNCKKLKELDIISFNTRNVVSMNRMFRDCSSLTIIDISNFDTKKVISMEGMFSYSNNLLLIYVGDMWDSEGTDVTDMFTGCGVDHVQLKE